MYFPVDSMGRQGALIVAPLEVAQALAGGRVDPEVATDRGGVGVAIREETYRRSGNSGPAQHVKTWSRRCFGSCTLRIFT
jgi:hypothetical protein